MAESEKKEVKKGPKELKEEKKEPKTSIESLTSDLKRIQAEFVNYKQRTEKENEALRASATEKLISQILPVLDTFQLALKNKPESAECKDFVQGVEMIYSQLIGVLENAGLKPIQSEGQDFNPELHQAVLTEHGDQDNKVTEELQKGYTLDGNVIRHAMVKVSKRDKQ